MNKRILAIGDIHGCYDKLVELLELVNYDSDKDQLILTGDLCDRGTQNVRTIFYARELVENGAIVLRGNHDELALNCIEEIIENKYGLGIDSHIGCGGYETYTEFMKLSNPDRMLIKNFLKYLPNYKVIGKYIFVHAGVDANFPIEENDKGTLIWTREEFYDFKAYDDKVIVFGHTPTKYMNHKNGYEDQEIWFDGKYNDKIGIDCGCVFYGLLACLEINTETNDTKTYYA